MLLVILAISCAVLSTAAAAFTTTPSSASSLLLLPPGRTTGIPCASSSSRGGGVRSVSGVATTSGGCGRRGFSRGSINPPPFTAALSVLSPSSSRNKFFLPRSGGAARQARLRLLPLLSVPAGSASGDSGGDANAKEEEDAAATSSGDDAPLFERFGRGIARDAAARWPHWKSDITDGASVQCLAATMFLVFACLAPAIGFGGLYGMVTNGAIGTVEMVSSTAACGILYALFAAQPLTIIGSTGPVLAFVATLAQLANILKVPFLPLYAWTGLWTAAILLACSLTSASNLVKYLTRFTDEIFSTLISAIFVVEAVSDVGRTFATSTLTKALLTLVTASATYTIATTLKKLRRGVYFPRSVRNTVSNFAPTIGVVSGALIARWARLAHGTAAAGLPALSMPAVFGTTTGRPWLVPLLDLPVWARWAAILPALMATVLLFLDQNITVRLVNNPRFKMNKGRSNILDGMHLDLLVIALLTAGQSLLGIPWLVAATVRSLSHVGALSKYNPDGSIAGSTEQRVTGVAIHTLIGACVLLPKPRTLLAQVPLPVLMGLFMYLGISALPGNEMWERIIGLFKDREIAPKQRWTDTVPTKVTNTFTLVQVACLGAMFWVKESPIGVLFPILIALLAPLKFSLEKVGVVKKEYMEILDEE
jgi:HCO3- transporter family